MFNKMALIFLGVLIIFTVSSFQFFNSDLSDTDNIVPFENTTPITLINLPCVLLFSRLPFLFGLIGVVFSNGTVLLLSGKSESVKGRTHQQKIKFHILWVRRKCR